MLQNRLTQSDFNTRDVYNNGRKKLRILLASGTAYPHIGGVENSLRYIGRELSKIGHEVKILCLQSSPDEPFRMVHEGIEIIRIPNVKTSRWPHLRLFRTVEGVSIQADAVIREFAPDAVWSRSSAIGLGIIRSGYKGPLIQIYPTNAYMHCLGMYLNTQGLPLKYRILLLGLMPFDYFASKKIERELFLSSYAVTFSEIMKFRLTEAFPDISRAVAVIRPGVDTTFFSPSNGARFIDVIEQNFGIMRGQPIVLYVGRLSSAKNVPLLIDAVSRSRKKPSLVLVGSGPERARLESYAERLGISSRIHFVGSHHELLPGFYSMSRVCVLPTTIESFGQTYLESMACGTPVIGFAGQGRHSLTATSEIIRDGVTGVIVREVSATALASAIDEIVSATPFEYDRMSTACLIDMQDRYSWRSFVEETLRFQKSWL